GPAVAALDVEQRRTPGVAETGGHRAEATVGEEGAGVEEAVVGFDTEDPVRRELRVVADLTTAHERAVVIVEEAGRQGVVRATEGATDVTTEVEAGPVVDRRG